MTGSKFLVPTTFANPGGLPIFLNDPIISPSGGTLSVFDCGYEPDKSASLIDGRTFTNLADASCAAMTGGVESARKPYLTSVSFVANDGIIEHTTKGAIHVALKQAAPGNAAHGWRFQMSEEVRQWIKDNPTHDYLYGLWSRNTRAFGSGTRARWSRTNSGGPNVNYLLSLQYDGLKTNGAGNHASSIVSPSNAQEYTVGVKRHVLRAQGWTGTAPDDANMAAFESSFAIFGVNGTLATQGSLAVYRFWFEDLTVSGRTPAAVAALDQIMYDKAFGVGGRFYNDTFTDPATV